MRSRLPSIAFGATLLCATSTMPASAEAETVAVIDEAAGSHVADAVIDALREAVGTSTELELVDRAAAEWLIAVRLAQGTSPTERRLSVHLVPRDPELEGRSLHVDVVGLPSLPDLRVRSRRWLDELFGRPLSYRAARGLLSAPLRHTPPTRAVHVRAERASDAPWVAGWLLVALHAATAVTAGAVSIRIAEIGGSGEWAAIRRRYPADVGDICSLPGTSDAYAQCRELEALEAVQIAMLVTAGASAVGAIVSFVVDGQSRDRVIEVAAGGAPGGGMVTVRGRF